MNIHGARRAGRRRHNKACMGWSWAAVFGVQGRGHISRLPARPHSLFAQGQKSEIEIQRLITQKIQFKQLLSIKWNKMCLTCFRIKMWKIVMQVQLYYTHHGWEVGHDIQITPLLYWRMGLGPSVSLSQFKPGIALGLRLHSGKKISWENS